MDWNGDNNGYYCGVDYDDVNVETMYDDDDDVNYNKKDDYDISEDIICHLWSPVSASLSVLPWIWGH